MSKRLLFIEDLYDYYENKYQKSTHFDYSKKGEPLVVQVHGKINFEESTNDTEGLLKVHLQACHTGLNINGSNISDEVMEKALPSFSNRPILGYIHEVDGKPEFYRHNMHEDENGEVVYDEVPVGIIPESCNAKLVYDEEKEKTYCEVDGYIFEEYSKAKEILEREGECSVSVELSIRSLSYNVKEHCLDIEDFYFSGVTVLGETPEGKPVMPGMEKSNIKISDFSAKNNSLFEHMENKMAELQDRLSKLEATYFDKSTQTPIQEPLKEGGDEKKMFEKLLEKYGKTVEDITFDYENLSDEELEAKFEECFTEKAEPDPVNEPEVKENFVCSFEISHDDIRYALYNILDAVNTQDETWYWISDVYDTYFIYESYGIGKIYKQGYKVENDSVSLEGERVELFRELLTAEEKAELESMRSNYAALKEFKETSEKNELHAQREAILADEKYEVISEKDEEGNYKNEAFAKLASEMDNYSLADLETQIKVIHSDYIAENSKFEKKTQENKIKPRLFSLPDSKKTPKSRYGGLFAHEDK